MAASDKTPLTELEQGLARKLCGARFPPYTASKRFARDLGDGYIKELSNRGRRFMARTVHRFRRQYALSEAEWAWVREWMNWEEPHPQAGSRPLPASLMRMVGAMDEK